MSYQGQAGSYAGIPVSVLRSFSPPPPEILGDPYLFRERIQTTTTGILAILGMEADPIVDREHILLSNIFETIWSEGNSLDLAGIIHAIQSPPFAHIGVFEKAIQSSLMKIKPPEF